MTIYIYIYILRNLYNTYFCINSRSGISIYIHIYIYIYICIFQLLMGFSYLPMLETVVPLYPLADNVKKYIWQSIFSLLEKAMAPHSSTLAWKIPWTAEPGRLQSMGSLRVGHDWATSLSLFTFTHWRRKWQPTPLFLPGESQGLGSLVGFHLCCRTESDTTEVT